MPHTQKTFDLAIIFRVKWKISLITLCYLRHFFQSYVLILFFSTIVCWIKLPTGHRTEYEIIPRIILYSLVNAMKRFNIFRNILFGIRFFIIIIKGQLKGKWNGNTITRRVNFCHILSFFFRKIIKLNDNLSSGRKYDSFLS